MSEKWLEIAIDVKNYIDGKGEYDEEVRVMEWLIEQAKRVESSKNITDNAVEQIDVTQRLNKDLREENKRYREAFKDIQSEIYDAVAHKKSSLEILEAISKVTLEALESDCIHCNGKGFNGLDYCSQCNQLESESDD